MKKFINISLLAGFVFILSSCDKFLDINDNPNAPLESTPELVLPQAITNTANNMRSYNDYGAQTIGYFANGGGVSGWGSIITYNYTTSDFRALWDNTYNNLMDYEYVIKETEETVEYTYYNAVAKIMKAYNFQLLVDTYNDLPYLQAFQGNAQLSVPYDSGADVYKAIADLVDGAIASVNNADPEVQAAYGTAQDPMFNGDMDLWLQFAQTLKLKLILHANGKVDFTNEGFDESIGFLTDDAIVNPGYAKVEGKQNRMWDGWAYSAGGTSRGWGSQFVPTPYIVGFYNGNKIDDAVRGSLIYRQWPSVPTNQLGYQGDDAGRGGAPNAWFQGAAHNDYDEIGIFKGPDAGQPLFLASEVFFMVAEANVSGLVAGDASANFQSGIEASFAYLYKDAAGNVSAGADPESDVAAYLDANENNRLVNFDLAGSDAERLEAIITQKYIAQNMILGHESWNDYRRTGYPVSGANPNGNETTSFVSLSSQATTPNRLPYRILYPASEFNYNAGNAVSVDPNSDKIFWDE